MSSSSGNGVTELTGVRHSRLEESKSELGDEYFTVYSPGGRETRVKIPPKISTPRTATTAGGFAGEQQPQHQHPVHVGGAAFVPANTILVEVSWHRWVVLFLFVLLAIMNQWLWITFSTINSLTTEKFGVDDSLVTLLSSIYFIIYIPFLLIAPLMMTTHSLRYSICFAGIVNCVGALVRYIACLYDSYAVLLVGQSIAALAQPFYGPLATQLASEWFPLHERALATGVAVLSNFLGTALGLLVGAVVINSSSEYNGYILLEFLLSVIVAIVVYFFFFDTPEIPPSVTAPQVRLPVGADKPSFFDRDSYTIIWKHSKALLRNPSFFLLFVVFGINAGGFDTVCSLASSITDWDDDVQCALLYFTFVMGGVVGAFVYGVIVSRNQRFKNLISIGYASCTVFLIAFGLTTDLLTDDDAWIVFIMAALCGFFFIGILTTSLEFGAELSYPIREYFPAALLIFSEQVCAVILSESMSLADLTGGTILYIIAALEIVGFILFIKVQERLGRVAVESGEADAFSEAPELLFQSPIASRIGSPKYVLQETSHSHAIAHVNVEELAI
eukprot:TRINITY_DN7991_c0_g1_i1.p2 TRINITY_DN7991_c0_g1~~TRINITY_DN7991_c0_g1_i1.p2  ORF type:complete len:559 (+),score=138.19 TRINITY_DN7991_c0_g1_i1:166-1842(+)